MTREQFIKQYYTAAAAAVKGSGIFPEVMLSQAIVESSGLVNGVWMVGESTLSRLANNYFGIKDSSQWTGDTISLRTGEYIDGKKVTVTGVFRKYPTIAASFADYVNFLKSNPRYRSAGVFSATSPLQQTQALQAAGYATDPRYSTLLMSVIDSFKKWIPSTAQIIKGGGTALFIAIIAYLYLKK